MGSKMHPFSVMPMGEGCSSNHEWGEGHIGGHQDIPLREGLELNLTTTLCCVSVLGEQTGQLALQCSHLMDEQQEAFLAEYMTL